jgi:lipopolysaccharide transport protein LptA
MKRHSIALVLLLTIAVPVAALAAAAAPAARRPRTAIGQLTIEAGSWAGPLQGPWTWSGGVVVTAGDTTLRADTVKVWPQKGGQRVQRIEATGSVRVTGTYTMAPAGLPPANWKVSATAQAASYDDDTQTAVISGQVDLQATNTSTGEVVTARAGKATYNGKTQQFRFEQSGEPVQVQWQEPPAKAAGP